MATINAFLAQTAEIDVEYNAETGRLRIANPRTGDTLKVFSNEAVYKISKELPKGQLLVHNTELLPTIVNRLVANKLGKIVRVFTDHIEGQMYIMEVNADAFI